MVEPAHDKRFTLSGFPQTSSLSLYIFREISRAISIPRSFICNFLIFYLFLKFCFNQVHFGELADRDFEIIFSYKLWFPLPIPGKNPLPGTILICLRVIFFRKNIFQILTYLPRSNFASLLFAPRGCKTLLVT